MEADEKTLKTNIKIWVEKLRKKLDVKVKNCRIGKSNNCDVRLTNESEKRETMSSKNRLKRDKIFMENYLT